MKCLARNIYGDIIAGEYTGYSHVTGLHHVSFYNGDTRGFATLAQIQFI